MKVSGIQMTIIVPTGVVCNTVTESIPYHCHHHHVKSTRNLQQHNSSHSNKVSNLLLMGEKSIQNQ